MGNAAIPGVAIAAIVLVVGLIRAALYRNHRARIIETRARAAQARRTQVRAQATATARQLRAARATPRDAVSNEQLYERAAQLVIDRQDGSISLLTRELQIGILTAVRVMGELERRGIVGPDPGAQQPREVLIKQDAR